MLTLQFLMTVAALTQASAGVMVTDNGARYAQSANPNGIVLSGPDRIYLGSNCDALIQGAPDGFWSYNKTGTFVHIGRYTTFFPDQIPAGAPRKCAQ